MIELWILSFSLILVRTTTFVSMVPFFRGKAVPRTVKLGLALSLTALWFPTYGVIPTGLMGDPQVTFHWMTVSINVAREILTGAAFGFLFGLFLLPLRIAGAYIGQEMGLSMATQSDPTFQSSLNVTAQLLESLGMLSFFMLNIHHILFASIEWSLKYCQIGRAARIPSGMQMVNELQNAHEWGLLLAAPVGISLFVAAIGVALLTKASPQMNLFSVGLTLKLICGLGALFLFMPEIFGILQHVFHRTTLTIFQAQPS